MEDKESRKDHVVEHLKDTPLAEISREEAEELVKTLEEIEQECLAQMELMRRDFYNETIH